MDVIKLQYYDEVYVKVIADPGLIMELSDYFTFKVPGYKFMPAFKNKIWSGDIFLLNIMTGLIYAGLVEQIRIFCKNRNYQLELEGIQADSEFSVKEAEEFIETLNLPFKPRDYQLQAFVLSVRKRRVLMLSPTASGKSLMIYMAVRYYNQKTLVIVPTVQLVRQLSSDFKDYGYTGKSHLIMEGGIKDSNEQITFSTWQAIYKMPRSWFEQFKVVVGDEAHAFKAASLVSIMTKLNNCKYRLGFTGTLDNTLTNKMVLEGLFGQVKVVTTTKALMDNKDVANLTIKNLILKYPLEIRKIVSKMDYQSEMDYIVTNERRNKFIKNLALSLKGNTLVMFHFQKQGKPLFDLIKSEIKDRKVFYIDGKISSSEREEIRHTIEKEKNAIIVASKLTTATGINIKQLHNLISINPSKDKIKTLQAIGRILRTSETKTDAVLYDIADDLSYKSKNNHTLRHFTERVKIYNAEKFTYKNYFIELI